jgi:WD40 repeat protein
MPELEVESGGPVWDLVAEFLERRERGDAVDAESFVRAHPDVGERLREALAGFQWMDAKARPSHAAMDEVLPRTFGNYQLLRVIGRGGMGCVYEAIHQPLKRHVAVKVLPPHLTDVREFRMRFLREARVVASLHHTNIAPVFEVGQIGHTLYLAMPFIDGPNLRELTLPLPDDDLIITQSLRSRLPAPFTAAYFRWVADIGLQAADALAHAHGRGVIHRDVKPSNLLMDEHGAIWMVDFGLAKGPAHPTVTQPGELIGTLRYASPEQVRGDSFDARTDVYSLGVTLYELLTRRPAFPPGPGNQVLAVEPPRPRRVNRRIPRDLETIVVRAMSKRPQDRYPSASALAEDLRRFLRDEPIRARPIGWVGRLIRWSRRNPAVTGVAAAAAFLLGVALAVLVFRESEHRLAQRVEESISRERYAAFLMASAAIAIESGQPERTRVALEMIREAAKIGFREEMWELAIRSLDQIDVAPGVELERVDREIHTLAVSPTGKEAVGVDSDGTLTFWDMTSGAASSCPGFGEPLMTIVWSPDGQRLLGVSAKHVWLGDFDGAARTLDDVRAILYKPATVAFSPDSRQIALWGDTLAVWDARERQMRWERPSSHTESGAAGMPPYQVVAWSPDGKLLVAVPRGEATLELWSMPDGERLVPIGVVPEEDTRFVGQPIAAVAFTPDSRAIACGCADGAIRIYDRNNGTREHTLHGHDGPVKRLDFVSPHPPSPVTRNVREGDRSAAAESPPPIPALVSADAQDIRQWDVSRNQQVAVLVRNLDEVRSVSLDRFGRILAVADASGTARAWLMPDAERHQVIGPEPSRIKSVATTSYNRWLAWSDERGHVTVVDFDFRSRRIHIDSGLASAHVTFSPGGTMLAIAGEGDPPIQLHSVTTGETKPLAAGRSAVRAIAFAGSGTKLAAAHADGNLIVWDLETGEPYATVAATPLSSLAASPNGKWLAGGGPNGELHLWNAATMSPRRIPAAHESEISTVVFSPDDQSVASASKDGRICRWRVPNLKRELSFEGAGGPVRDLAFCLDGSTLVSCGGDGRVFLWATDRVARVGSLNGRATDRFDVLGTSSDGRLVVAAGRPKQISAAGTGSLEIWDLAALHQATLDAGLPDWRSAETSPARSRSP